MARRRVEVVFIAEMSKYRRGVREGAEETRKLRDEAKDAQREVADLGAASDRAADEVSRSTKRAAADLTSAAGDFADAGAESGRAFADGFTRDAQGRLRDARGRFVAEGERLGEAVSRGVRRGARRGGGGSIFGGASSVFQGGRAMLLLAGGASAAVAALQVIPPVLSAIGGGLGAIPSLAAGATGSLVTLGLGLNGIGDALDEVFNPKPTGGGGGFDDTAGKIRRLESAERSLARAQRDARLAQLAVGEARRQATRDLRDMAIALGRVALDERDAQLSLEEAQRRLAELQAEATFGSPGVVDPLEMRRAQLAVDQARQTLVETRVAAKDLRVDQAAAAKAGVEGSEQVQAALRRQADAQEAVIDATNAVTDAQEALSRSAAGGGAAVVTAYSKLSPAAKAFVDEVRGLKDELVGIQQLAQERVFRGLDDELNRTARVAIPFARKEVARFGDTWNDTFRNLARLGRDPQFLSGLDVGFRSADRFFDKVNARIPVTGRLLANLFTHAEPFVDSFGDSLLSYIDDFDAFITRAARDGRLDEFFADAAFQADALLDIGKELFRLVADIGGLSRGSTVLRDMADALQRFNDQAHNTRDLNAIIEAGNAAIRGVVDVLSVLGETLADTLADPSTRDAIEAFFDVVGTGAQAVKLLVDTFNALPGPLKTVLLTTAGAYLVYSRLQRILGPLGTGLGRLNTRLADQGPLAAKAARGMDRLGRAASVAGVAIVGLEAVGAALDSMKDTRVEADRLAVSLEKLGKTGQRSGELARIFGEDTDSFERKAQMFHLATDGVINDTGRLVERIPGVGAISKAWDEAFNGTSYTQARENIRILDDELAAYASTTDDTAAAQAAYDRLLHDSGLSAAEFAKLMPDSTQALRDAGTAAAGAARSNIKYADSVRGMSSAIRAQTDPVFGWIDAQRQVEEAQTAVSEAQDTYGKNSPEYRRAVEDLARAQLNLYGATGDVATAADSDLIPALQQMYEDGVISKGALDALKSAIDKARTAAEKADGTRIRINTREAMAAIRRVTAAAGRIRDIHVGVFYDVQGNLKLPGGRQIKGAAKGEYITGPGPKGVDSVLRLVAPGEMIVKASDVDAAGGPQAFQRVLDSLGRDGERYVSPTRSALEFYGYSAASRQLSAAAPAPAVRTLPPRMASVAPVVNVTVTPVAPSGNRLMDEVVDRVRYVVRTDGGGDVQKALGR